MNIIIPMAGRGSRLRPHTLLTPKPLIQIVGKPIVERLVLDIVKVCKQKVENIVFVIGDFGSEVEDQLLKIAQHVGANGHIRYQQTPLGTAHAIFCAQEFLNGNCIVAFADTLFKAAFDFDLQADGIIWTKQVENPSAYGVVKFDQNNFVTDFVEKPATFVSDQAIIGIYYFKDAKILSDEIAYLIDNKITVKGEYQLTDALQQMNQKGQRFVSAVVEQWLDCGNKDVTVQTNSTYLTYVEPEQLVSDCLLNENSVIIPPVFIGKHVVLKNSVIGPFVSIADNCQVIDSRISESIIGSNSKISGAHLKNSMLASNVGLACKAQDLSLGDYTEIKM